MVSSFYTGSRGGSSRVRLAQVMFTGGIISAAFRYFNVGLCGCLNVIGLHKNIGSGTISRYSLVATSIYLDEVYHCGGGF